MAENNDVKRFVQLQEPTAILIERIQKHREEKKMFRTPKNLIIAEAISILAEKEFAE